MGIKMIGKLILVVAVCAGVFFGYRYLFPSDSSSQIGVTTVDANGQPLSEQMLDNESQQFLSLLASVENVGEHLKENFVQDRFFKMLQDYTVPVTPRPISRSNPFLPIGSGGQYLTNNDQLGVSNAVVATTSNSGVATTTATTTKSTSPKTTTTKSSSNIMTTSKAKAIITNKAATVPVEPTSDQTNNPAESQLGGQEGAI